MTTVMGYGTPASDRPLAPVSIERRDLRPHDVRIDILYCGICHSDLHVVRDEWHNTIYPTVPGHEIVGRVSEVGGHVKTFKQGDLVAVGCMVDSCMTCASCKEDLEQFCESGMTQTYNSKDRVDGSITKGGYSESVVVTEHFVLRVPANLDISRVAPLVCAGITTYSPLRHWNVGPGSKVGVVGLGGLGHMALKLAHAFGAEVTMISTSTGKEADARRLGAHHFLLSNDKDAMAASANQFDFILDTVPSAHPLDPLVALLKRDGDLVLVGAIEPMPGFNAAPLVGLRKTIAGSLIGGIKETQEMLDFCAEHNVLPDCEIIRMQDINEAYERLIRNDVKYRFVIDMASLKTKS